jgi:hypothetical protein
MKTQLKIALGAIAIAAATIPGSASAGGDEGKADKAEIKVSIKVTQDNTTPNDDVFEGKVRSDKKGCRKEGRVIQLIANGSPFDTSELAPDGSYSLEIENPHQTVFPWKARIEGNDKCKTGVSKGVSPGGS